MSFYTKYWSTDGRTLIGGVVRSQTSRFQLRSDAQIRMDGILDVHPNRKIEYTIVESELPPEIFYHCKDYPATTVGCRCFGCKKVLTMEDARNAGKE